jgi:hypothetical protein
VQSAQAPNGTVVSEQNAAVSGSRTAPIVPDSGAVSAPGVGAGHAANGLPIGTRGSGPGSPEQPIDSGSR